MFKVSEVGWAIVYKKKLSRVGNNILRFFDNKFEVFSTRREAINRRKTFLKPTLYKIVRVQIKEVEYGSF